MSATANIVQCGVTTFFLPVHSLTLKTRRKNMHDDAPAVLRVALIGQLHVDFFLPAGRRTDIPAISFFLMFKTL
jgi:hypothetical protein